MLQVLTAYLAADVFRSSSQNLAKQHILTPELMRYGWKNFSADGDESGLTGTNEIQDDVDPMFFNTFIWCMEGTAF